jgi:hypothetical protein
MSALLSCRLPSLAPSPSLLTSKTFTNRKPLLSWPICSPTALVMTFSTLYFSDWTTPFWCQCPQKK